MKSTETSRCLLSATMVAALAWGCGGARPGSDGVEPMATPGADSVGSLPVAVSAPEPTVEDAAADREALQALRELRFTESFQGSEHLRGVTPPPSLEEWSAVPNSEGRSGGASVRAPSYDIEIESFAEHDRVQYYMDFFQGPARDRFTIWLGRLNRYEGLIRRVLRGHGVPEDLVYLALIESGYSNTAVSRAGAVGMWQFIPSTGRRYGLTIDTWVDERRDPFKATDAAARHLRDLNIRFGSWYLAAAAYNGGPGRVSRGLSRLSRGPDAATDETFFDLSDRRYLRRETRDYVPKLIAAAMIAKEPLRYRYDSIPFLQPLLYDEITVPYQTGLDVLGDLADTSAAAMMELNPQYYRGVTPPGRKSLVRVPLGKGSQVLRRYRELDPNDRVNFIEHRVRRGETLSHLADRYRIRLSLIRAANPGVNPRRLRVGQRLVIPLSAAARQAPRSYRRPASARRYRSSSGYHLVRWGESLSIIARRYGVRVSDLRRWNDMRRGDVLPSGSRLRVAPPSSGTTAPGTHLVRWGESLSLIAQRYGVTVGQLRRWNRLAPGDVLVTGTRLVVRPPASDQ